MYGFISLQIIKLFMLLPPPLGYRKNIPLYYPKTEEEIKADSYERYHPNVLRSARNFYEGDYGKTLLQHVRKHLENKNPSSILELGCGSGFLIGHLAKDHPDSPCIGFDYSYQMLKMASQVFKNEDQSEIILAGFQNGMQDLNIATQHLANLNYALSDACTTPLPDQSIDFCFSCFLFDRVGDPLKLIKEKIRVLKPEGAILIISPFNYLKSQGWRKWHPISQVVNRLIKEGLTLNQHDHFQLEEPLDARRNRVIWEVDSLLLTHA